MKRLSFQRRAASAEIDWHLLGVVVLRVRDLPRVSLHACAPELRFRGPVLSPFAVGDA